MAIVIFGILASIAIPRYIKISDERQALTRKASPLDQLSIETRFEIDRILKNMTFGNIVFNTPESLNIYDTVPIELLLSITTSIDDLKRMVEAEGKKEGAKIKVSDRMEAKLTSQNFTINPITPETQAISQNEVTQWKWEITPKSHGTQYLYLNLSALISINNESTPRSVRIFTKVIKVQIKWDQSSIYFIKNYWQQLSWIVATITSLYWFLYKIRKHPREKKAQTGRRKKKK